MSIIFIEINISLLTPVAYTTRSATNLEFFIIFRFNCVILIATAQVDKTFCSHVHLGWIVDSFRF